MSHVLDLGTAQTRLLAVDLDFDGGVVELLLKLEVTQRGNPERRTLRDWLDLFNHRLISLFFRAWEKYRFPLAYERGLPAGPEPDAFTRSLYCLVGLGLPPLRGRLRVSTREETYALPEISAFVLERAPV